MHRFVIALVCTAMVWFVPSTALAAIWDCHVEGIKRKSPLHDFVHADIDIVVDDTRLPASKAGENPALVYAVQQWSRIHGSVLPGDSMIFFDRSKCTERPANSPTPVTGGSSRSAPTKKWSCRVDLVWHVGSRSGKFAGVFGNSEPTEAAAMGRAIFDAQQYLLARTLKNTKPAWSKTDVKCS